MKIHSWASGLLSVLMVSGFAHAQLNLSQEAIIDLPLFEGMEGTGSGGASLNESSGEQVLASSLRLSKIPRTTGGTEFRLELGEALSLDRLDLRIVAGRVKLHRVAVILVNGQEFDLTVNTEVLAEGTLEKLPGLSSRGGIREVRILAESFGQESDLLVTAVSTKMLPQLALKKYEERPRGTDPIGDLLISEGLVTQDPRTNCGKRFCVGETVIHVNTPGTLIGRIVSEAYGYYTIQAGNRTVNGYEADLAKTKGCDIGLCVGEFIYVGVNGALQSAEVIGYGMTGFVIKYNGGYLNGITGGHWTADLVYRSQGCVDVICVGEYVIMATAQTTERGRTVGLSLSGKFAVEEYTGIDRGKTTVWSIGGLAKASGCSGSYCVGDTVLNIATQPVTRARVIGQRQGVYVLEFLSAPYTGRMGGGWEAKNLALTQGCSGQFCVGNQVRIARDTRVRVQIIGIDQGGYFVIQFLNGRQKNQVQAYWPAYDLTW